MGLVTKLKRRAIVLAGTSVAVVCLMGVGAMTAAAQGQGTTSISATVSAAGYFTRTNTYTWTLSQSVSPSSAQFTLGSTQKFTHTLTACRMPPSQRDTNFGVQGQVCVTNGGSVPTTGLLIAVKVQYQVGGGAYQDLPGAAAPPITPAAQLPAGGSQCYSYIIPFTPVSGAAYRVVATVTVTNHSGTQTSGPSPKSASFTLTTPTQTANIDDKATVTDVLQPLSCSGFTTKDSLDSPSAVSVGTNGCATMTFTVRVTNASSTGAAGCPLMDTVTLTGNTSGLLKQASATVTLCYPTQYLNSCLQDELVLQAFVYPNGVLNGNGLQASFLQDLLNQINLVRASVSTTNKPVPPLARIVPLESAAQDYSQVLVGSDPTKLSHYLIGNPASRAVGAGYDPTAAVGENLAAGQWSAQEVINAWVKSPEHYANLINPQFTQVGLGLSGGATSDGSQPFVLYWVADFGSSTISYLPAGGGAGTPTDVRGVVAQLHSYLQMADAALCAGDTGAVAADLGPGGFVDYWKIVGLVGDSKSLSEIVGVCLNGVLGFYSASSGANYATTTSYIQSNLILG